MKRQQTKRFDVPALLRDRLRYELERQGSHKAYEEKNCEYRLDFIGSRSRVIVRQFTTGTLTVTGEIDDTLVAKLSRTITRMLPEQEPGPLGDCVGKERVGSDESGKGDYFGPLVTTAVHIRPDAEEKLVQLGVRDCKQLTDRQVLNLADELKRLLGTGVNTVLIMPERYNKLYDSVKDRKGKSNVNELLAWSHLRAISDLVSRTDCKVVVIDRFARDSRLADKIYRLNGASVIEVPGAEEDTAVAAASVVARSVFCAMIERLQRKFRCDLPKGAGEGVIEAAREFVQRHGREHLIQVAKLHFRTTQSVLM